MEFPKIAQYLTVLVVVAAVTIVGTLIYIIEADTVVESPKKDQECTSHIEEYQVAPTNLGVCVPPT